jgi:hypothetical protein
VTLDGETRPSEPIVIVAICGLPPPVGGGVGVGVVGVDELPPPQAAAVPATMIAASNPPKILVRIRRISSPG